MDKQVTEALAAEEVHYLSLLDVSEAIRTRTLSPIAVTEALLSRIEDVDGRLKSYTTVTADHARASARQAEEELRRGLWRGPLHGVPVAVKDLCNTTFAPTSAGMHIHAGHMAARNATVVDRLIAAGAVILGKLSMTEGAMSGHHPRMNTPVNPWLAQAWTGVSSSGSGVATAAGLCYASLGSDTGGSIRLPSSANGLTGVKPTWGRVSRAGVWALADSLDHVGPMTRSVGDSAAVLAAIAGFDADDTTTLTAPVPDYLADMRGSIAGLRIGFDERYALDGCAPEIQAMVREALGVFVSLGARPVPVSFPDVSDISGHWLNICAAECAAAHSDTYPSRKVDYGPALSGYLDIGHSISARQLAQSMQYRLKLSGAVEAAMLDCDVLLVPALSTSITDGAAWERPMDAADVDSIIRFTAVFDMTGQPTLSLNGGFDGRGLPMGFQLVGKHLAEPMLFRAGHAYQSATSWHTAHPTLN